jgi:uncharacterized protein
VVHFEVVGRDGPALRAFYSSLFDWTIDAENPANYGLIAREETVSKRASVSAGASGSGRRIMTATSPSTSRFPTSTPHW